jgi:hypothetical protein
MKVLLMIKPRPILAATGKPYIIIDAFREPKHELGMKAFALVYDRHGKFVEVKYTYSEAEELCIQLLQSPLTEKEEAIRKQEHDELYGGDPDCKGFVISHPSGSGAKCSECEGWFCY